MTIGPTIPTGARDPSTLVRSAASWLAALACGLIAGPALPASPGPDALKDTFGLSELTMLLKRESGASATFSELQYRKILKEPIRRQGELLFTPPALFEKRVLTPVTETYRMEGETLSVKLPDRETRLFSLRNQPMLGSLLLGFKAVVSGQLATLEGEFAASVSGGAEAWQLDLQPTRAEASKYIELLRVTGRGPEPLRFEIIERNGDRTVTEIEPR